MAILSNQRQQQRYTIVLHRVVACCCVPGFLESWAVPGIIYWKPQSGNLGIKREPLSPQVSSPGIARGLWATGPESKGAAHQRVNRMKFKDSQIRVGLGMVPHSFCSQAAPQYQNYRQKKWKLDIINPLEDQNGKDAGLRTSKTPIRSLEGVARQKLKSWSTFCHLQIGVKLWH